MQKRELRIKNTAEQPLAETGQHGQHAVSPAGDTACCPVRCGAAKPRRIGMFLLCNSIFVVLGIGVLAPAAHAGTLSMPPNGLGLIEWYTLDGGTITGTSIADESGSGNVGTLQASATEVGGKLGQALATPGNTYDAFTVTPLSSTYPSYYPITISAWVKASNTSSRSYYAIYDDGSNTYCNGIVLFGFMQVSGTTYEPFFYSGSYAYGNTFTLDTNWHLYTGTWDGTTVHLYIDGKAVGSAALSKGGYEAGSGTWGGVSSQCGTTFQFYGSLDDARIYNRVLSATEVKTLYNMSRGSVISANPTFAKKTIYLTKSSGTTWKVPNDWNATGATIEAIGPGGNGGTGDYNYPTDNGGSGGGGQGGGYGKAVSPSNIKRGDTLTIQVGAGGSTNATYLKDDTGTKIAQGDYGAAGSSWTSGSAAGGSRTQTNIGIGGTTYSGGNGGNGYVGNVKGGGGGGGAAGPHGNGAAGGASGASGGAGGGGNGGGANGNNSIANYGGQGGASWDGTRGGCYSPYYLACSLTAGWPASNGSGGGGADALYSGQAGGNGQSDWPAISLGSGGGGGGAGYTNSSNALHGGNGGNYGGGGGGGGGNFSSAYPSVGGTGGDGVIVITYTPKAYAVMNQTITPPNLANGLVGHWTFDGPDLINNVADSSGNGNNGALITGGAATSSMVTPGVLGQALKFNGTNQYVSEVGSSVLNSSTITVSAWVKLKSSVGGYHAVVTRTGSNGSCTYSMYELGVTTGDDPFFFPGQYYSSNALVAPDPISLGSWYNLVGEYSGANATLYINGIYATSTPRINCMPTSGSALYIGKDYASYYFPGSIDDVRIYNRALSAAEVQQLYNLGR